MREKIITQAGSGPGVVEEHRIEAEGADAGRSCRSKTEVPSWRLVALVGVGRGRESELDWGVRRLREQTREVDASGGGVGEGRGDSRGGLSRRGGPGWRG